MNIAERRLPLLAAALIAGTWSCARTNIFVNQAEQPDAGHVDAGHADGGSDAGNDGGEDGGVLPDGGTDDGGSGDAGQDAGPTGFIIAPHAATVKAGATLLFTASFDGNPVNAGWNAAGQGSIDATGLYTAPTHLVIPSPADEVVGDELDNPGLTDTAQVALAPAAASQIFVISGDGQSGAASTQLSQPLQVQLSNQYGNPSIDSLAGLDWTSDGAAFTPSPPGVDGSASAIVTLLPTATGAVSITATARFGDGSTGVARFTATVLTTGAAKLVLVSGNQQNGTVSSALPKALVVQAFDASGNPAVGASVAFGSNDGGACAPSNVLTAADGTASSQCNLGPTSGQQSFTATGPAGYVGSPVTFIAFGLSGVSTLSVVSGQGQSAQAGTALAQPLVAIAQASNGAPLPGVNVAFAGPGSCAPAIAVTGPDGTASSTCTLGANAGGQTFTATAAGFAGSPVAFSETANPAPPGTLVLVSGSGQSATEGDALGQALVVRALHADGSNAAGVSVTFTGAGTCSGPITTGTDGLASATCALGSTVGAQQVTASATNFNSVLFNLTANPVGPGALTILSGDNQTGQAGNVLGAPLVVKALDANGGPSAGAVVTFASSLPGASCAPATVTSAADGTAQSTCTLGTAAGTDAFTATAPGYSSSPVTFHATVLAAAASNLAALSGAGQTAVASTALPAQLVVVATDRFGNLVGGVTVTWASSTGTCAPPSGATIPNGQAAATCTLGSASGVQTFTASSPGLTGSPVPFSETASSSAPNRIVAVSGGGQTGTVGVALGTPLTARVLDGSGNGVPNVTVTFAGPANKSGVAPASIATDANGNAQTNATLGQTAGQQTFTATVSGLPPASFIETASPGAATLLTAISGNGQTGTASTALAGKLVVAATDQFTNVVAGATVTFVANASGASASTAAPTDSTGRTSVTATLGAAAGVQTFTASLAGGSAPVVFTETATAAACPKLQLVSGDAQSGAGGAALAQPFVVLAYDGCSTSPTIVPLSGQTVSFFQPPGAGASVVPTSFVTGADGKASTTMTLPTAAGSYTYSASLPGGGAAITVTETATSASAAKLVIVSGNGQSGAPGIALPLPLVVEVEDASGNPVSGTLVTFATTGGGSVAPSSGTSGTNGQISTGAILGGVAGVETFTASATGLTTVSFSETATSGTASKLKLVSGDAQTGTVGAALGAALVVELDDGGGNPISGASVRFTDPTGAQTTLLTGANGQASYAGKLGTVAGAQTFTVDSTGVTPVTFHATAVAAPAAKLVAISGSGQTGGVNTALAAPIVAEVEDQFGNAVSGTSVAFAATGGGGKVAAAAVTSGANGQASTTATLGPAAGTDTFSASVTGLTGSPVTFSEKATAAAVSVTVAPFNGTVGVGFTLQFHATENFSDGSTIDVTTTATWSVDNAGVASVNAAGLVSGIAGGKVNVKATVATLSGTSPLTVTTTAKLVSISMTPLTSSIGVGATVQLAAIGNFSDGSRQNVTAQSTWTSNVGGASVSAGLVKGVSASTATITATVGAISGSGTVSVTAAQISQVQVSPSTVFLASGTTQQLTCTATYTDGSVQSCTGAATWSTANANVAAMDGTTIGLVHAIGLGATNVTATYSGLSGSATINVTAATLVSIALAPTTRTTLPVATTQAETAVATYSDGSTQDVTQSASWSSSNAAVASVSDTGTRGVVTAQSAGTAVITATFSGQTATLTFTINNSTVLCPFGGGTGGICLYGVANVTACGIGAICNGPGIGNAAACTYPSGTQATFRPGMTASLKACAAFGAGFMNLTFQDLTAESTFSTDNLGVAVALATPSGNIQSVGGGSTSVSSLYGTTPSSQNVTVNVDTSPLQSVTVSCAPSAFPAGTTSNCTAFGHYGDSSAQGDDISAYASFVSSNTAAATVSNASGTRGQITGVAAGSSTISASFQGVASSGAGNAAITISAATLTALVISPASNGAQFLLAQTPQQFRVTAVYSDGSQLDVTAQAFWTSSNTTIATVANGTNAGRVAFLKRGTAVITAAYGGLTGSSTLTIR